MSNNWIPVTERLPDEPGFYIRTIISKKLGFRDVGVVRYEEGAFINPCNILFDVLAWQPHPEPYNG